MTFKWTLGVKRLKHLSSAWIMRSATGFASHAVVHLPIFFRPARKQEVYKISYFSYITNEKFLHFIT